MKNLLEVILFAVVLASCNATDRTPFRKMTEEELIAYNSTMPLEHNVFCFEDVRTGSFIKKKRCMTLRDIMDNVEANSNWIGTLNYDSTPDRSFR